MGRHRQGALSVTDLGVLLSPPARARTVGAMQWVAQRPTTRAGDAEVQTVVATCRDGALVMRFAVERPWAPKLVYRMNDVPVRRACINAKHADWPIGDHLHMYVPASGLEDCAVSEDFSTVPIRPTLDAQALRSVFHEFAEVCAVDVDPSCWSDPPDLGR